GTYGCRPGGAPAGWLRIPLADGALGEAQGPTPGAVEPLAAQSRRALAGVGEGDGTDRLECGLGQHQPRRGSPINRREREAIRGKPPAPVPFCLPSATLRSVWSELRDRRKALPSVVSGGIAACHDRCSEVSSAPRSAHSLSSPAACQRGPSSRSRSSTSTAFGTSKRKAASS